MKSLNQSKTVAVEQEPSRAFFRRALVAAGLAVAAAAPTWANTDAASLPDPAALENWREAMAQTPPQEAGCYYESYPSLVRERAPCSTSHPRAHPAHRPPAGTMPDLVGHGTDYIAQTTAKTFWAGGSFLDVSGIQSEQSVGVQAFGDKGNLGPNEYTLQLNTNEWGVTAACGRVTTCHVWQQFVYDTNSGDAQVYIQYWLLDYGSCPPDSAWNQSGENCFVNGNQISAPNFPVTDLANLSLHAAAHAGGTDCVAVYDNTGAGWDACDADSELDISSVWDKTEFGIFGDGGGSQAQFNFGTSFVQLLQVNDGTGTAPACHGGEGTTGETNNLNLGPCAVLTGNGLYPRIRFTESNPFSAPVTPSVCGVIVAGQGLTPGHSWHSCDKRFTLAMQTDSNLVLYEGSTALWWTGTVGQDVAWMVMQGDGNLVLYNTNEGAVWNSGTGGFEYADLNIQDDGNLVIYLGPQAVWASNTCCH
jgi:hypothetical protein